MLVYPDVRQSGRIGEDHRSQVSVGEGAVPYEVEDLAGHRWTFSETLKDVAPEEWGGETRTSANT